VSLGFNTIGDGIVRRESFTRIYDSTTVFNFLEQCYDEAIDLEYKEYVEGAKL
jgi:hypothetical protein